MSMATKSAYPDPDNFIHPETPDDVLAHIDAQGVFHGGMDLGTYDHQLPKNLKIIDGDLRLEGYEYALPEGLAEVKGLLHLGRRSPRLPESLRHVGGIRLRNYPYRLPFGIETIGAEGLSLGSYKLPLPQSLKFIYGDLLLWDFPQRLPSSLKAIWGDVSIDKYRYRLPPSLKLIDGDLILEKYKLELPEGLIVGGDLYLHDYRLPLPSGMQIQGAVWGAESYEHRSSIPKLQNDTVYDIKPPTSAAFRRWFGSSKVVDVDGAPRVVFHGTPHGGFSAFSLAKKDQQHPGFYFADTLKNAKTYIYGYLVESQVKDPTPPLDQPDAKDLAGAYRVYLRLENPEIIDCRGSLWKSIEDPRYPGMKKTYQIATEARRRGFDGIIFKDVVDSGGRSGADARGDVYVAFEPTQIKSALFNTGEYSSTDPDIRKNPRRTSRRRTSRGAQRKTSRSRA